MISRLRKPYSNEADDCVKLIYISGPDLYTYVFFEREPKIYEFIKLMYDSPDTLFSKENAIIEAEDGKIRGLVLAYPASYMKKIVMGQIKSIKGILKISGL